MSVEDQIAEAVARALEPRIEAAVERVLARRDAVEDPDELLTTYEAAKAAGKTVKTVRWWIESGRLKTAGGGKKRSHHRIRRADLDAALARSRSPRLDPANEAAKMAAHLRAAK